jgi:hypothetical protein
MVNVRTAPEAPLPPLSRLLAVVDPQAPAPQPEVSETRALRERTPLMFGGEGLFADEQASSWRAGPWLLRETRLFHWTGAGPVPGAISWAIQRDDGRGLALLITSSASPTHRETWGPVLGERESAQRVARAIGGLLEDAG